MKHKTNSNGRRQRASRDKTDCRMIWLKVGFHTDFSDRHQLRLTRAPKRVGKYWRAPGNCWDSGFIRVLTNDYHQVEKGEPIPFNATEELLPKLLAILQEQGVVLHRRFQKIRPIAEVMARFNAGR
jgi:hypothetical protein